MVVPWLAGGPRQRRTGIGWAALRELPPPAPVATWTVLEVDAILQDCADASGAGSAGRRRDAAARLLSRATGAEQQFLRALIGGELRQGAQTGVLIEAVALAGGVSGPQVRRAMTLGADLAEVAVALRRDGPAALAQFRLRPGRAMAPMLARSAPSVRAALELTGDPAAVETKLDGVRVQVHRDGGDVAVFTRSLEEITDRLPEVVAAALALPVSAAVLDGEVIALRPDGRPLPFQVTASRAARRGSDGPGTVPLTTQLFDALHLDGDDLLDEPTHRRRELLQAVAGADLIVAHHVVQGAEPAQRFADRVVAAGHEGVLVKSLTAPYAMGRRGLAWVKVKPRITLDLVVLAVEHGHGRRRGHLSNLHLGARDPAGAYGPPEGFVMLGKTFKGLTDAMLSWQSEHLRSLAVSDDGHVVRVRPELVVEIALDGVQTSPRYPAGLALRFARVLHHRPDKPAAEADTIETVREYHRRAHPDPD